MQMQEREEGYTYLILATSAGATTRLKGVTAGPTKSPGHSDASPLISHTVIYKPADMPAPNGSEEEEEEEEEEASEEGGVCEGPGTMPLITGVS